jgi:hypothetical protein
MESRLIVIRKEQMAAFALEGASTLRETIVADLRRHSVSPAAGFPASELESFVGEAMAIASRLGMDSDKSVFEFVCLCLAVGLDFELQPSLEWMRDVLADGTRTAQDRLLEVRFRLRRYIEASRHE